MTHLDIKDKLVSGIMCTMPSLPTPPLLPPLMMPLMPPQRVLQSPQENCIFFYSKVDAWSCRVLCDRLRELDMGCHSDTGYSHQPMGLHAQRICKT